MSNRVASLRRFAAPQWPSPRPHMIRAARLRAGLTQSAAARLLRVSPWAVVRWERAVSRMPAGLFELLLLKTEQTAVLAAWIATSDPARNPDRVTEIPPHPDIDRRRAPLPPIR